MIIHLETRSADGRTMVRRARPGTTVDEICEIAECEVNGGYAVYAAVYVDREIYVEYES